ncbi:MAG: VanZ family protein [Ruminococcaceae bacterium]|nr:VanZ family protein [Oscillospiraceae bacterium]
MISISYLQMVIFISVVWIIVRAVCCIRKGRFDIGREAALLLVYICIVVVVRFTFCPFGTVYGKVQPLLFDKNRIFPPWVNFVPFVYLFDYPEMRDAILNLVGNIAMFIPLGIVWPSVFRELNTHTRAIAAGVGVSLCIEILQLPFFDRASDIDDLLLNSFGYILGYGIYVAVKKTVAIVRSKRKKANA